jgi:hypothetical protein
LLSSTWSLLSDAQRSGRRQLYTERLVSATCQALAPVAYSDRRYLTSQPLTACVSMSTESPDSFWTSKTQTQPQTRPSTASSVSSRPGSKSRSKSTSGNKTRLMAHVLVSLGSIQFGSYCSSALYTRRPIERLLKTEANVLLPCPTPVHPLRSKEAVLLHRRHPGARCGLLGKAARTLCEKTRKMLQEAVIGLVSSKSLVACILFPLCCWQTLVLY